jgi:hypothetical protein
MALVTPGTITLANYDSSSPQVVLTYPQISTGSSSPFYPSLIWSPDSQLLYVAIPPSDPRQDSPYEPTTLWSLPVYGGETVKLTEFPASWGISSIAPNLSLITYPTIVNDGEVFSQTLHIIQPNGTEIATFPNRGLVSRLPDSTRFIFYSDGNFYVGTLSGESIQISGVEREILGLFWLDNDRFLLYHRDEAGQEKLSLGTIGGELAHIIQGKMEAYPIIIK